MLSVLIPIYNHDSRKLIQTLQEQCAKANIAYEIVCFDDGSTEKYKLLHRPVSGMINVSYIEMPENYGRSKIRNKLGQNARYDWLLFLDCDSKIKSKKFIKRYLSAIQEDTKIVYGGTVYNKTSPKAASKILHWKYGSTRECPPFKKRLKKPYLHFKSNNFLIDRDLFIDIQFNEELSGYGYEDLLFASVMKNYKAKLIHIENPVLHTGLSKAGVFLDRQRSAIKTLARLYLDGRIMPTRLTRFYEQLGRLKLLPYALKHLAKNEQRYISNLQAQSPSIYNLDKLKLLWLYQELKNLLSKKSLTKMSSD